MNDITAAKFGAVSERAVIKRGQRRIGLCRGTRMMQRNPAKGLSQPAVKQRRIQFAASQRLENPLPRRAWVNGFMDCHVTRAIHRAQGFRKYAVEEQAGVSSHSIDTIQFVAEPLD